MEEINLYLNKINDCTITPSDIDLVIKMLKEDTKKGRIKATKEDIQWFEIYKFGLEEMELENSGESKMQVGDWRKNLDYSKARFFVDEMDELSLIENVSWHTQGVVIFDIKNTDVYRIHLFRKMKNHLCKLYSL
ncbi:MAG: hypothetical protein ACOCPU_00435 [Methanohalophilus sp.]